MMECLMGTRIPIGVNALVVVWPIAVQPKDRIFEATALMRVAIDGRGAYGTSSASIECYDMAPWHILAVFAYVPDGSGSNGGSRGSSRPLLVGGRLSQHQLGPRPIGSFLPFICVAQVKQRKRGGELGF